MRKRKKEKESLHVRINLETYRMTLRVLHRGPGSQSAGKTRGRSLWCQTDGAPCRAAAVPKGPYVPRRSQVCKNDRTTFC